MDTIIKINEQIQKDLKAYFESDNAKSFITATKEASEDSGRFEMIITTESIDRMGEVIKADGWDFTNYMNNPIVLWGHDYHMLPVGVTESITKVDGNKWLAKGKFAPESANPMAQHVRKLYDLGIQRASSVGFIEREREGNLITKAELLEWSFVTVPANPMALSAMVKSGLSINEMVTKGLLSIKEGEAVETKTDVVPPVEEKKDEKAFVTKKEVVDAFSKVKEALVVLERTLAESEGGSEYNKPTPTVEETKPVVEETKPEATETVEEKAMREFMDKRRIVQSAVTVLNDILAETRKAINNGK